MSRNVISCSWGDHLEAWDDDAALDTPEKILKAAEEWQSVHGAGAIYWREMRTMSRFRVSFTALGSPPREVNSTYANLGFDEQAMITTQLKDMGFEIYMYTPIFDEGFPLSEGWQGGIFGWQSQFTLANPEYLAADKEGRPHYGILEYAHDDARRYTLRRVLAGLADYDFDGVFICTRSQSKPAAYGDQFGFNQPVVEEFEKRYGINILERNFDLEAWRRLRGEFITQLLRDLKAALSERGKKLGVGVPRGDYIGPPLGNLYLDWRTWIREKIVDSLTIDQIAVRCPSFWHLMWPKHRAHGLLCNDADHYGIKGGSGYPDRRFWSIPLPKGSPEYQQAMDRLYGGIRDDYAPLCLEHGCKLNVARMWSRHDPEENARLLDTEGVSGVVIGSFGAEAEKRVGEARPQIVNPY